MTERERALREGLHQDIRRLAGEIGERNIIRYENLTAAADFIETSFAAAGYQARRQGYDVGGKACFNIEVEIAGADRPEEIVVVGAHYDSVIGSPGANDNATGAAAVLALARAFAGKKTSRTVRFVAFVNEEPPLFLTAEMGSRLYARRARQRNENIAAMLSLETIGYYSDAAGSQKYLFPLSLFYPSRGDFIGFVGNLASRRLLREVVGSFRDHARFPSEGAALPEGLPGVGWSDHISFWQEGYSALMVTDTAFFRYPFYHTADDTPDRVDYDRLARVVAGLESVAADLVGVRKDEKERA